MCVFLPGGSSPPDTRRRCRRRLRSLPSGRRCQPDESLSHGFIDGQSRLRRRLKCQVDSQTDGRVAAVAAATAALDLDFSRSRRSFWSCKSRKSCRFQQVNNRFLQDLTGPAGSDWSSRFQQVLTGPTDPAVGLWLVPLLLLVHLFLRLLKIKNPEVPF